MITIKWRNIIDIISKDNKIGCLIYFRNVINFSNDSLLLLNFLYYHIFFKTWYINYFSQENHYNPDRLPNYCYNEHCLIFSIPSCCYKKFCKKHHCISKISMKFFNSQYIDWFNKIIFLQNSRNCSRITLQKYKCNYK